MFFVLVRNDSGESFGLVFNLYESKLFRNRFANHSELFRTNKKTLWISFDANLLKINTNQSILFPARIHSACFGLITWFWFMRIESYWFSTLLYTTRFQMFFVLLRNDPGESFGLEFNSYQSNLFWNLLANHSESIKKTLWISFDANLLKINSNYFKLWFIWFDWDW